MLSKQEITSLQVIKPQKTWLNEVYCLFFLSWLPTSSSPFLLCFLLSVLPALLLSYCTLLNPFILNLSCAFFLPSSHESLSFSLSLSKPPSRYISLTLLFLSLTSLTLLLPIPPHAISTQLWADIHHTHMYTLRNRSPYPLFCWTFPSSAHFEISLATWSFISSSERIRNSYISLCPSLLSSTV